MMVTEDFGMNFYQRNCGKMVLDFLTTKLVINDAIHF